MSSQKEGRVYSRRSFIIGWAAAGVAVGGLSGATAKYLDNQRHKDQSTDTFDPSLDFNVLYNDDDIFTAADEVVKRASKLDVVEVDAIHRPSSSEVALKDFQNLIAGKEKSMEKMGIGAFSLLENPHTGELSTLLWLHNDVRVGGAYNLSQSNSTPEPAWLTTVNDNEGMGVGYPSGFDGVPELDSPKLDAFRCDFRLRPEQLAGKQFTIFFNKGLLNYKGKDLSAFMLPGRYTLKSSST